MHWRKKEKVDKRPEDGTRRGITKFLLVPKKINRETRWLEKATYEQIYYRSKWDKVLEKWVTDDCWKNECWISA